MPSATTTSSAKGTAGSILVTGSDDAFFPFARDLIESLLAGGANDRSIGFLDLGLAPDQRHWLEGRGVLVRAPQTRLRHRQRPDRGLARMGYLARPFLREVFPDFGLYVWLDADTWLQDVAALQALEDGAWAKGAAMVRQDDPAYRFWPWLIAWQFKHFIRGYGLGNGLRLGLRAHINNGVFAMAAQAPHWDAWCRRYQSAIDRTGDDAPHDQFGLNAAIYLDRLPATFLPATCNWICNLATPMWDATAGRFCAPYPPHAPIGVLHLAGPAKANSFDIRTTSGSTWHGPLRYGARHGRTVG
ncbi:hypothetical protein [Paracraurococcus ruber]|uniref:Glycosyltransferase n=1 Tax=Paracraurococcus ruber TaxID=77675 RepID=A0ABS1CVN3_9PROT|nr:hypothetical protein [Paracraurococcus ruber]MBK1658102.1 hypothetical protein [Paracraurococcus ruber]TDG32355.1 hypothetical protein E2C05_07500 [Paracraurococcus ruber]